MDTRNVCLSVTNISLAIDTETLLWIYNEHEASYRFPTIWFSLCVLVIGVFGNGLVVYSYGLKFNRTTANVYILWLAIFDLIGCLVGIPFETFTLRFPMMYGVDVPCRLFRYVTLVGYVCQIFILLCISVDRFFKVCRPFTRMPPMKTSRAILMLTVIGIVLSSSSLFIFGKMTITTCFPEVVGVTCSISDDVKDTIYPTIFYSVLSVITFACMIVIAVLYVFIVKEVLKWKRGSNYTSGSCQTCCAGNCGRRRARPTFAFLSMGESKTTKAGPNDIACKFSKDGTQEENNVEGRNLCSKAEVIRTESGFKDRANVNKTAVIFSVVSLSFIISYLPYFAGQILLKAQLVRFDDLTYDMKVLMEIFAKSYYLNNMTNPVIYSIFNTKFRNEIRNLFLGQWK